MIQLYINSRKLSFSVLLQEQWIPPCFNELNFININRLFGGCLSSRQISVVVSPYLFPTPRAVDNNTSVLHRCKHSKIFPVGNVLNVNNVSYDSKLVADTRISSI